jgi:hypothetical protein
MDPVYMIFDFYVKSPNKNLTISDINQSMLYVYKSSNTRQSNNGILNSVIKIITDAFNNKNVKFGQFIDINQISSDIINLDGVDKIKTYRADIDSYVDGLSLLVWNQSYPLLDVSVHNHNFELQYFQYPAFNNVSNLLNRIKIVDPTGVINVTDY